MVRGLACFRWGSAKKKSSAQDAISGLREQLGLLQEREKQLQSKMDEQVAIARKSIRLNEAGAREALEQKKIYAEQCAKTQGHIMTLRQQLFMLESASINKETLDTMQQVTKGIKKSGRKLPPEKMDKIRERLQEHNALRDKIAEAQKQLAIATPADAVDLETELENLRNEGSDWEVMHPNNITDPTPKSTAAAVAAGATVPSAH